MEKQNPEKKKRTRVELIYDILKIIEAKGGKIKPTHLMYKANLSHISMKGYLAELMKSSLLKKNQNKETNKTLIELTNKGREFLSGYSRMKEFEKTFGI